MIAEFLGLGAIALIVGAVFVLFPRHIERSIEDAFARVLGDNRSYVQMSARVVGAVLLLAGVLLVGYAIVSGLPLD